MQRTRMRKRSRASERAWQSLSLEQSELLCGPRRRIERGSPSAAGVIQNLRVFWKFLGCPNAEKCRTLWSAGVPDLAQTGSLVKRTFPRASLGCYPCGMYGHNRRMSGAQCLADMLDAYG